MKTDLSDDECAFLMGTAEVAQRQLEQTRSYLLRGRLLEALSDEQLASIWADTIFRWAQGDEAQSAMVKDATAEFALRNLDPPVERVRDVIGVLAARGMDALSRTSEYKRRRAAARILEIRRLEQLRPN